MTKSHRYRRSTPVVRLLRNSEKIVRHAELAIVRLEAWKSSDDPRVLAALDRSRTVLDLALEICAKISELDDSRFVPPPKDTTWIPEPGQHLAIAPAYRQRYEEAMEEILGEDPTLLDDLVMVKMTSSGEIVVRRGRRTPFCVRKSHLVPAKVADVEKASIVREIAQETSSHGTSSRSVGARPRNGVSRSNHKSA